MFWTKKQKSGGKQFKWYRNRRAFSKEDAVVRLDRVRRTPGLSVSYIEYHALESVYGERGSLLQLGPDVSLKTLLHTLAGRHADMVQIVGRYHGAPVVITADLKYLYFVVTYRNGTSFDIGAFEEALGLKTKQNKK